MGNSRPQTALPLPPTEKNISEARDVVLIGHRSSHFELLQTSHIFYSAPPPPCAAVMGSSGSDSESAKKKKAKKD